MAGGTKWIILFLSLFLPRAFPQETGEAVVLVYNRKMAGSREVADHYAAKRAVPTNQIVALDLPESEVISREDFETKLQQPLWAEMRARKLLVYRKDPLESTQQCNVIEAKVRYAVLCYGVPVKIAADPNRKEEATEALRPELRRNEAAVDSELALLPLLDRKLPIVGVLSNPGYSVTNAALLHPTNGVLMVARLDGPTAQIASSLVDKAMQAEADGLWGRAYFDTRGVGEGALKAGDDWIHGASEVARIYGYETVIEKTSRTFPPSTPLSDIAFYFGWYDQSVSGPFTNGMAQFRPGAVAYHLHSFSSRTLRVPDVWWTGPLLAAGATATMGCTEEPYLQTTPQPNVFLWRFVILGFSFGEAALTAQPVLSWQNTIIGDPLYRPFAKTQKERYIDLEQRKDTNIVWSMLMWINFRLAQNAPLAEILQFYADNPESKTSALLQEKLGDIYKSRGKIFDAVEPYSKALNLPLEPLQKMRVSLTAGSLFSSLSKNEEAYAIFQGFLREFPQYPDKKDI
ncbi:MAG TPA: TIGR03790 family protein, partial [Verrucomicrobiae bacterium]|nr:TIGR03790 family protein [Verrucomicrobiae bacterium]